MSWPAVEPRTSSGRTWRGELAWQMHEPPDFMRAIRRLYRQRDLSLGPFVGELEALRRVRAILPEIRTRRQLFVAAAWQPFKLPKSGGRVSYLGGALEAWAKARAAGKRAPWEAARKRAA